MVHDLAAQLPSRLTADLLGFPEDRWEDIKSWSERLMRTDSITCDEEALMGVMSAIMEFNPLLEEMAAERKGCPADDLISTWAGGRHGPAHDDARDRACSSPAAPRPPAPSSPAAWRSSPSTPTSGRRPPPTPPSCPAWSRRSSAG